MFVVMTIREATILINNKLKENYEDREAASMTDWIFEKLTGAKKADLFINKDKELSREQSGQLKEWLPRLMNHEPLQYVLQEAWFGGMKFYVDKNVLIPRPETEELVNWITEKPIRQKLKIIEIGTGSGCVPILLKKKMPDAEIWACDVSEDALAVAKKNASGFNTDINFFQMDFLNEEKRNQLPSFDVIVSNPPYVPEKDKQQIQPNVLHYEPATALFVPDDDALIFYKAIIGFGKKKLHPGGSIFVEIHEDLGETAVKLFQSNSYETILKKDMQGKDRMVKAVLPN